MQIFQTVENHEQLSNWFNLNLYHIVGDYYGFFLNLLNILFKSSFLIHGHAAGDIFSCHAIDNPDVESEMAMLQRYGPDVPKSILRKLVLAFSELRELADQGLIAYPYSTREVVNMVKHLQVGQRSIRFQGEPS